VWKAYHLLKDEFAIPPVEMHLLKSIPFGAGLGGGSSDAAHALMMLSDMCSLGLDKSGLEQRAASLGSDCAFFIRNEPVLATGRGEVMTPVEIDLSAYDIRIARPGVSVSTAEAYAMVKPRGGRPSLREIIQNPLEHWKGMLFNDFEESIFKKYPMIRELREVMYQEGAIYAAMSGSGSAVYGIFPGN
jgi:4-diphosphocytidyl-2-C-methyl-D-erythritol kinase